MLCQAGDIVKKEDGLKKDQFELSDKDCYQIIVGCESFIPSLKSIGQF